MDIAIGISLSQKEYFRVLKAQVCLHLHKVYSNLEASVDVLYYVLFNVWGARTNTGRLATWIDRKKCDLTECNNQRGITLMVLAAKVPGRIVITRIQDGIDNKLRQEQAGFRKGRGTTEKIFILCNIFEQ